LSPRGISNAPSSSIAIWDLPLAGELAGLRWSDVDLEKGVVRVARQFSHGAWAELKTANARRSIPLAAAVRDELKTRYAALNGNVVRIGRDDRTVFCAPEGGPLDYKNFRDRVWARLLERTGPTRIIRGARP
jgi:integrase